MSHPKILIQLDTDSQASVFDGVVAVDAGIDHVFRHDTVTPDNVVDLIYGAILTRSPTALKHTAIFVGGSDVLAAEAIAAKIQDTFFGPIRVSVMMDSNGCNTTAAAAVIAAGKHLELTDCNAIVLGSTGPVGLRVAELLALEGTNVTTVSRSQTKAQAACDTIINKTKSNTVTAASADSVDQLMQQCMNVDLIISAAAAGTCMLPKGSLSQIAGLRMAIDLNAVPPAGLADIKADAKSVVQDGITCYGSIGIGNTKMKIHQAALSKLFESNQQVLDTQQIYDLACAM